MNFGMRTCGVSHYTRLVGPGLQGGASMDHYSAGDAWARWFMLRGTICHIARWSLVFATTVSGSGGG